MRSFRGRTALVTGAASGIGRAIAIALAAEGAALWLVDIDEVGLFGAAAAARALGALVETMVCDLADPAQVAACARAAAEHEPSVLVNAAGVLRHESLHLAPREPWDRVLAVNLLAPTQLARELLPTLLRREEACLLNVCSLAGLTPFTRVSAYQTSKFGLVGFTLALRAEYQRPGFGVTCLCPGFVRTPLLDKLTGGQGDAGVPGWASTTPERVARRAIRAMRAGEGLVVVTPLAAAAWLLWRLAPSVYGWCVREGWRARRRIPEAELDAADRFRRGP